jgi:hypothetical protein
MALLGCMFLDFTPWLVFYYSTVRSFRKSRRTRDDPKDAFGSFSIQTSDNSTRIHSAVIKVVIHSRNRPLYSDNYSVLDLVYLIKNLALQVNI